MTVDESKSSNHSETPGYQSATSKANAVARMYFLGNQPVEPLGPGSKEKKSALVAMVLKVPKSASLEEIVPFSRALTPCGSVTPAWSVHQFDFCAFSGRAVYFTPTGDVLVSDYVLPFYGT